MQIVLQAGQSPYHLVYAGTQGRDRGTVVNFDFTDTIIAGPTMGDVQNNTPACYQIGPLNSVTVDGGHDVWVVAATGSAAVEFMQGVTSWEPSPAQSAIQISTLGLATENTLSQVNGHAIGIAVNTQNTVSTLGSPAQDATVGQVNTTLGTPAQNGTVSGLGTTIPSNIATSGAPLLALANNFTNTGPLSFTSGQTRTIGPGGFGQISWEGIISATHNASDTMPSFRIVMQWLDASNTLLLEEIWYLCGATTGQTFMGSGRAKGAKLQMLITNDGSLSATLALELNQSSRVYVKDDWRSLSFINIPGFTTPNVDPAANVLCASAPTVAASASVQRSLPLYAGTVRISALTQTGSAQFIITTLDTTNLSSANTVWTGSIGGANGQLNQQFDLPRYQCIITLTNTGGSSQQLPVSIVASEQNI